MRKKLKFITTSLTVLFTILLITDVSSAQRRARGNVYSKQYIEQLLERIEERNDAFTKRFDEALDDSRLDTTRAEENYTDRSRDLENATDELRREFDHNDTRGETSANVRKVLNIATDVNRIMTSRNFGRQTELTWAALRSELNTLATIYRLPVVGSRTYRPITTRNTRASVPRVVTSSARRNYSKQQLEQLLERIEERTDAFSNQLNKSLDRSRLNGSRVEDGITDRSRDLENATDELRREFDHNDTRGETSANVRTVLSAASVVDSLMRARNFGGLTESTWVTLRSELNTLASLYSLQGVNSSRFGAVRTTNRRTAALNTVPVRRAVIIRGYSQQQVEELLERIEERADDFTNQLNKSLDRSRLNGTRSEDNIAELARDLGDSTDELRREFDHNDTRGENRPETQRILAVATNINRLMRSRNFGGQTESTWVVLRNELNTLARLYGLSAVGAGSYR